ncbi:MAG: PA2169 family four-helix-bundle protein [Bacteroidota bacterium]
MTTQNQISALNDLLAKAYDAEKGYQQAADNCDSERLTFVFNTLAEQRRKFGHEIKDRIKLLGGLPEKGDSVASKVHRFWMDLRTTIAGNDDVAILAEVQRGEQNAIKYYDEALKVLSFDPSTSQIVERQRNTIEHTLNRMESLEEVHA